MGSHHRMGPREKSTMADTENSPTHKNTGICARSVLDEQPHLNSRFSDKMARENFEIGSKKGDTLTYCVTCTADISIGKGKGIRFIVLYPPKCSHDLLPLAGLYTQKPFQSPGGYSRAAGSIQRTSSKH